MKSRKISQDSKVSSILIGQIEYHMTFEEDFERLDFLALVLLTGSTALR